MSHYCAIDGVLSESNFCQNNGRSFFFFFAVFVSASILDLTEEYRETHMVLACVFNIYNVDGLFGCQRQTIGDDLYAPN